MTQSTSTGDERIRYVFAREGSMPVSIPGDIADAVADAAGDGEARERALDFAGLVVLRLGHDAGTNLLRHWQKHDASLVRHVDQRLVEVLAHTPELITGPLRS